METQLINTDKSNARLVRGMTAIFWLGFFMSISFMEAPLKFSAPGLSMAEGLQIGRMVFGMLNHCEWVFLAIIVITCFIRKPGRAETLLVVCAALVLIPETCWLLPALDRDAGAIISGKVVTSHSPHWCYVALEFIKVPVLLLTGVESLLKLRTINVI